MDLNEIRTFVTIARERSFSGAAGTLANARLTDVLRAFTRRFPKVRLVLQTATSREVGELVRRGDATLGLRYLGDDNPDLVSQTVAKEALVVVACAGHRLANGRRHE